MPMFNPRLIPAGSQQQFNERKVKWEIVKRGTPVHLRRFPGKRYGVV